MLFALSSVLALAFFAPCAFAQVQTSGSKSPEPKTNDETYQTIYLINPTSNSGMTEVVNDLRNMLPMVKVYGIPLQNAISIRGTVGDIQLAQKIVSDVDRPTPKKVVDNDRPTQKIVGDTDHPAKTYRITYTITEKDGDKSIDTQRYVIVVLSGEKDFLKQGKRVPVFVGTNDARSAAQNPQVQYVGAQVQYLDVGMIIEATGEPFLDGLKLHTKIEQSSPTGEMSGVGPQDPVLHQSVLDGTWTLELGKPLVLGLLDVQESKRQKEIEVVAELVR
jgi:hypothetical protein